MTEKTWTLPEPAAVLETPLPDGNLVYVRRHGNPDGPRIMVSHGCGLAADAYLPYWSLLLERFDLFAFDLRSHGWNPPGNLWTHTIPSFVQDCERVLDTVRTNCGDKPVTGVFHSLSALVALLTQAKGHPYSALVLFDPPVYPAGGHQGHQVEISEAMGAGARKRRDRFDSPEQLVQRLLRSPAHQRMVPGAAALMAETTLRPSGNTGGYELRCPKEHEAQVFDYMFGWATWVDLKDVSCPVKVIGSDPTEQYSFIPAMDLRTLVEVNYDFIPETTHFLQLEQPEQCAALTVAFLESQKLM